MAANNDTQILIAVTDFPVLIGQPARPLAQEESISGWIYGGLAFIGRGIRRILTWIRR